MKLIANTMNLGSVAVKIPASATTAKTRQKQIHRKPAGRTSNRESVSFNHNLGFGAKNQKLNWSAKNRFAVG